MDCTLYSIERMKLFTSATQKNTNFEYLSKVQKFQYLMQNVWKETSKFIHYSIEARRSTLYQWNDVNCNAVNQYVFNIFWIHQWHINPEGLGTSTFIYIVCKLYMYCVTIIKDFIHSTHRPTYFWGTDHLHTLSTLP